jgi:hypothetical protein
MSAERSENAMSAGTEIAIGAGLGLVALISGPVGIVLCAIGGDELHSESIALRSLVGGPVWSEVQYDSLGSLVASFGFLVTLASVSPLRKAAHYIESGVGRLKQGRA